MEHSGAKFLVHMKGDKVGVVTADVKEGESVKGVFMDDDSEVSIKALSDIPLGHKIALVDVSVKDKIIEYGEEIGVVTNDIRKGDHVHVHNLKSIRW